VQQDATAQYNVIPRIWGEEGKQDGQIKRSGKEYKRKVGQR
jgi:hypothetical protein